MPKKTTTFYVKTIAYFSQDVKYVYKTRRKYKPILYLFYNTLNHKKYYSIKHLEYMDRITKIILGLSMLLIFTGCSLSVYKQPTKIGIILPFTGNLAQYAEEARRGIDMALAETKLDIKVTYQDSKSEPKDGVSAFHKILTNKVTAIITGGSNVSLSISPLANSNKIIQMAIFSSISKYTSPDDFTFRVTARSKLENEFIISWLVKSEIKKTAFIYSQDEWGQSHYNFLSRELEQNDIEILTSENFQKLDKDFHTQLTKIKSVKPKTVFIIARGKTAGLILKQAEELELDTQFLGVRAIETADLISIAGAAAENIIYPYSFDPYSEDLHIKNFIQRYETRYGEFPTAYVAEGYDSTNLLIKSIEVCHSDTECIKNYLTKIKDYTGILGNLNFDKNGDIILDYFLKTVRNGKFVKY
jgi:branched-chain amino acid transport system substrate-binding protein